jgi:hypothetical protein
MEQMKSDNTEIKALPLNASNTEIKRGGKRHGAGRKPLPPERKRVAITIRISRGTFDRLCLFAIETGTTKTNAIEYLINNVRYKGQSKLTPLDEVTSKMKAYRETWGTNRCILPLHKL